VVFFKIDIAEWDYYYYPQLYNLPKPGINSEYLLIVNQNRLILWEGATGCRVVYWAPAATE
jgi:hypothetical protein